jgi:hypothetical protein
MECLHFNGSQPDYCYPEPGTGNPKHSLFNSKLRHRSFILFSLIKNHANPVNMIN